VKRRRGRKSEILMWSWNKRLKKRNWRGKEYSIVGIN
jgi:hypothetical protein